MASFFFQCTSPGSGLVAQMSGVLNRIRRGFLHRMGRWFLVGLLIAQTSLLPAQAPSPTGLKAYPLKHVQAEEVAVRLRKLMAEMSTDAKILSDAKANQILVQGSTSTHQLAVKMLQTLDQPAEPVASSREVKGYRVDGDLSAVVSRLQGQFTLESGARIAADERTKRVIVVGNDEVQREVAKFLQTGQFDAPRQAAPPVAPKVAPIADEANNLVHALQNITWRDLEGELVRLWGDQLVVAKARNGEVINVSVAGENGAQPVIQIDRRAGEVFFTGNGRTNGLWRTVVEAIDSPRDPGQQMTQLVPIRNADPQVVRATVSLLNDTTKQEEEQVTRSVPLSGTNRRRSAVDLVGLLYQQQGSQNKAADAAPQAAAPQTPARAAQVNPAPANPAAPPARTAPGAAAPAAAAPADEEADDGSGGLIGPVQIEILFDTIIIRGNKRDVARVKKIIEELDRISETTRPVVEIYQMQHLNGEAAATLVTELYTEILASRQGQVSIRALVEPNAILLIGREESVKVVRELIEKLDQPSPPASKFEVFPLKHVSALDAEQTVRNFFVNRPGTDTNVRTGLGTRVQIVAEFRTNSLIVQASPRDLSEVRRLIESLDVENSGSKAELRVFKLKNALAETLATVLQAAISGQPVTGGQQQGGQGQQQQQQQGGTTTPSQARPPSASLEFMLIDQAGGKLLQSGILADAQVTADTNTNSLVVRAPSKSMELIAALIDQLDKLPDASAQVKVFTIVNGNATSLATMLQTLFGQAATAGQGAGGGLFGGQTQLQAATAGGESSLVPLRFAIDQRTNSIIASGSESDLHVVETILLRLDEDLDDRRLSVVRLRNTQASSVAAAVQQYLTNLQQQVQTQLLSNQSISAFESVERQVFVIPENVTNSLIVSASPRYQEEILRVIQDLDIRPPMVMVQVLIAEVTLNNTLEFGAEFGLQDSLVFDRGKAVGTPAGGPANPGFNFGGYTNPNQSSYQQETLAGQSLTSFAVGRTSSTLGYGGLVLSAANESVNILLRALQDEGRLQILSRPQVMTMHNQPAYVQVGANVARPSGSTVSNGISQQNVLYVDTGIILSILPLINDDGVIVMGIEAERSALGSDADGTTISSGVVGGAPIVIKPLNITKASTTISARDGQTVAFAGLITKNNQVTLRRVPYLSDVPVLGNLFKFESNFERRSELLIVMTPYLIRDDNDAELMKLRESERMSWCLADVVNVAGDMGLRGGHCAFCNNDAPMIYPDSDPTGSRSFPTPAPPPLMNPQTSASEESSSRREDSLQPVPVSTDNSGVVGPPVPEPDGAAMRSMNPALLPANPTQVTYGPAPRPIAPAAYQPANVPRRLPAPK